jgi:lipopolysaccharide transport system permease protein
MNYQSSAKIPLWQPVMALVNEHSGLIRSMVRRDLTSRYKGSMMGLAWTFITPAIMIVIFTLIFQGIFNASFSSRYGVQEGYLSYGINLYCGLLPWIAISDGIQRSTISLIENVNLVKRVVFPIEALPVNLALSAIVQQLIGTVILLIAALILEHRVQPTILLLPLLMVPQLLVTIGLGWLMASLGVFIRDMPQFNHLALQMCMYITPIFYPEHQIPERFRWVVTFNPLAPLIRSYRRILLEGSMPDWSGLMITLGFGMVCFVLGYWWFQRTKKAFADVL